MANKQELLTVLENQFSLNELDDLCFKLGIDFQNVPGQTKDAKARELIEYCSRREMLNRLEELIAQLRPGAFIESDQPLRRAIKDFSRWFPITVLTVVYVTLIVALYIPVTLQGDPKCKSGQSVINLWSNVDLLVPMMAGIYGLYRLRLRSDELGERIHWAFRLFAIGVAVWACGEIIWMTYNFIIGVDIPYPSLADIAYAVHGIIEFVFACVLWIAIRDRGRGRGYVSGTIIAILVFANLFIVYALRFGRYPLPGDPVKLGLDIAYPTLHAISLGLVLGVVLSSSFRVQPSQVRSAILMVLVGLGVMYLADATFAATTSLERCTRFSYYNGNWVELLFTTAFWLIGVGMVVLPDRQS